MNNEILQILNFLKEIEKLKSINRRVYNSNNKLENDAEHSWHLAMFILLFQDKFSDKLNTEKMLRMALIHDLVEIYSGDIFTFDIKNKDQKEIKQKNELKSAKKLFSQLPLKLNKELMELFLEYEENKNLESKYVKAFDKLQPILQNLCSNGKSWKEKKITKEQIIKHKINYIKFDETVYEIFEILLQEGKDKKLI